MATNQKSNFAKSKFKKFAIQNITTNFSGALAACHKIELKKVTWSKLEKVSKNMAFIFSNWKLFCQKGIKLALSYLFYREEVHLER